MRAAEFIRALATVIDALDGTSENTPSKDSADHNLNPVFVPPLQQSLELQKAEHGKQSPVIDKITADDDIGAEPSNNDDDLLDKIKQLITR